MNRKHVIVGVAVAVMAFSLGLRITQWQWWAFIVSANVALAYSARYAIGNKK